MDSDTKLIVGLGTTLTVGSFMLSSIVTQDQQLAGRGGFNADEIRNLTWLGWLTTGGTGIATGIWAKSKPLMALGAGIAIFGTLWTLAIKHPIVKNKDGGRLEVDVPRELTTP